MFEKKFTKIANGVAYLSGLPTAFILCVALVVIWGVSGPVFGFSDTWQLVINTGTTIITFLMVFLIQNTQNRDGAAMQAKLDELIRVTEAQNNFIGIEHLTETEVEEIREKCEKAAKRHEAETSRKRGKHKIATEIAREVLEKVSGKDASPDTRSSRSMERPGKGARQRKASVR